MNKLEMISPVDGRYRKQAEELADYFSEKALISYRIRIEAEYLIALSGLGLDLREFSESEKGLLRKLREISVEDAEKVKETEKVTNHDVKAVEYFIKEKLKGTSLEDVTEWVHFALT